MDLYIKPDRSFNFYQGYYFSKSIMASHTRSILDLHKLVCACIFAVCVVVVVQKNCPTMTFCTNSLSLMPSENLDGVA